MRDPSRRELLRLLLGAPLMGQLACDGLDSAAPARIEGDLSSPSFGLGHRLREGTLPEPGPDTPTETVDVAILGGGVSGLSAGYHLAKRGETRFAVYELEPTPGGTSKSRDRGVVPHPLGAHYIPVPLAHNTPLIAFLEEMKVVRGRDADGHPLGVEEHLVREPESRVFYRGYWYPGLFPAVDLSPREQAERRRFQALLDHYAGLRDARGRRAFTLPARMSSDDPDLLSLDRITAAELMERHDLRSPRLRWLVEYACRDDYGLGAEEVSAWAALFYWVSRMRGPGAESQPLLTWPEGNGALVAHLLRTVGDRLRSDAMTYRVRPTEDGGVEIHLLRDRGRRLERVRARRAIVALPRFVACRVVDGLAPEDAAPFRQGAWWVANLHLRSDPRSRGFERAWDNVLYDSPSVGYVDAGHAAQRDHGRTVWTYYRPLWSPDADAERRALFEADHATLRDACLLDLGRAHVDLEAQVERIDIHRWGHGMVQPRVGVFSGEARRRAMEPRGPIHFAHTDLSAMALFEEAFDHGVRAADEVWQALRST